MPTMTAEQRRRAERDRHRSAVADCPTQRLMERLADKWFALLVRALADGPRRHGELSRAVPGAGRKMLTQTLRNMERDGLVRREVTAAVPPRVDYALTPLGTGLVPVLAVVTGWADNHMSEVAAARAAYDMAQSGNAST